jgi:protein-tyrosine phosphatase
MSSIFTDERDRMLPLTGGRNFRDTGGYATADGCRVRRGMVFRSGAMAYLTNADHAHLRTRGIRLICDLRTAKERNNEPNNWPDTSVKTLSWEYDPSIISLREFRSAREFTADSSRDAMTALYRRMPRAFSTVYADVFRALADDDLPAVIHCSAGKDRTGLASALILLSLGVQTSDVMNDYTLTERLIDLEHLIFAHQQGSIGMDEDHSFLSKLGPDVRRPLVSSPAAYLEAALKQIRLDHGSVEGYIHDGMGIAPEVLQRLRTRLLEG